MRFQRLDLNLLVALDALIEDRSVSVAARRLYLSQPAMSGALNRLRDYFGDELLVQSGRQMLLTPKAEELRTPVRDALVLIRSRITTPLAFDPATSERNFVIAASDYVFQVLLADVLRAAAAIAPRMTFELVPTGSGSMEKFERGEVDLLLTISGYTFDGQPQHPLFEDEHAVIAWSGGTHGESLGEAAFLEAGHAVAFFGPERHPAFTETWFEKQGIARRIELRVPSFSLLPYAVIGTDRVATMYRRHADVFARSLPITLHSPPVPLPRIVEMIQWHSMRDRDEGLRWLADLILHHARAFGGGADPQRTE